MNAPFRTGMAARLTLSAFCASLGACGMLDSVTSASKIDYRTGAAKTAPLDIPPDLTQLSRDPRYTPQSVVSASSLQQPAASAPAPAVAPTQVGQVRLERNDEARWLVTSLAPEDVWPRLRDFWQQNGFTLAIDSPETGTMETEWAENRARIPEDFIRRQLGKVLDSAYSSSERDRFRTRVERTAAGTEISITHRGMEEVLIGAEKEQSQWTPRPRDPGLEGEFLSRLMVRLGSNEDAARTAVAATNPAAAADTGAPKARTLADMPGASLEVDDGFDRAWRRVGLALDRGGFTVEDRDRSNGAYYVRYIDPKHAYDDDPNIFEKMWSSIFGDAKKANADLLRYRLLIKSQGEKSQVSVTNAQGVPDNSQNAQRIVAVLVDDLK